MMAPKSVLSKEEFYLMKKAGYWPGWFIRNRIRNPRHQNKPIRPIRRGEFQFHSSLEIETIGEAAIPMISRHLVDEKENLSRRNGTIP